MESKLTRSEKDRRRRQKLKSENPEEYRRRQDLANEKQRAARGKMKDEKFNRQLREENERLKTKSQLSESSLNPQLDWCFRDKNES